MEFHTYGEQHSAVLLLLPGLGVSHEIFQPLVELLSVDFQIVAIGLDGFLLGGPSRYTSIDDQACEVIRYVREHYSGRIDAAYGLSLGGKILSRILERNEVGIDHAIMDAAPLLPLPRWLCGPLRYYQSFNVWTCYHWPKFWRVLLRSHYIDVLLYELRKVYPSGGGRAVRDGYKNVYTSKLESISGPDIHYWYGSKEALVARPQVKHLKTLCPRVCVEVFKKMNHGQLLVDHPEEVARRIKTMVFSEQMI